MSKVPAPLVEDISTPLDEFLQAELYCCLCGGELDFFHEADHLALKIKEVCQCPKCKVQVRTCEGTLH